MKKVRLSGYISVLILIGFTFTLIAAEDKEKPEDKHASAPLPGVEPAMLSADYWISIHDDADQIVLTSDEIQAFNEKVRNKRIVFSDRYGKEDPMINNYFEKLSIGLYMNPVIPYELPETMPGDSLRTWLNDNMEYLNSRDFYDSRNVTWSKKQKRELIDNMNIDAVPNVITRTFGLIVERADMRLFPTFEPGFSNVKWALDYFQTTAVYSVASAAVLHRSKCGDYYYVQTAYARGWMAADTIALTDRKTARMIVENDDFMMSTGDKVAIYGDQAYENFLRFFYMSEKLPLQKLSDKSIVVRMPYRQSDGELAYAEGYIKTDADVHRGHLFYTKENVYRQMFKMIDNPYGWADQFRKRDCSGTVRVVLYCFGFEVGRWPNFILLAPDNITYIDPSLPQKEQIQEAAKIEGGITMCGSGGHIALFLGKAKNGRLYFMHQGGWGYDEGDQHYYVNRVQINEVSHSWYYITSSPVFSTFR